MGFELNMQVNGDRKASKYSSLIMDLKHAYSDVKFANLSMSAIDIIGKSSESLLLMLDDDLHIEKSAQSYIIKNVVNKAIRSTYYVFCCRNKPWNNPDLLDFELVAIYTCLSFYCILYIFSRCYFFEFLRCNASFADSQLHAALAERCMIVIQQYIELYEV